MYHRRLGRKLYLCDGFCNSIYQVVTESPQLPIYELLAMKQLTFLLLSAGSLLATPCDLIDYHPYDARIERETDVYAHHIEQIKTASLATATNRFITRRH